MNKSDLDKGLIERTKELIKSGDLTPISGRIADKMLKDAIALLLDAIALLLRTKKDAA